VASSKRPCAGLVARAQKRTKKETQLQFLSCVSFNPTEVESLDQGRVSPPEPAQKTQALDAT
jgi:hypothetical protein